MGIYIETTYGASNQVTGPGQTTLSYNMGTTNIIPGTFQINPFHAGQVAADDGQGLIVPVGGSTVTGTINYQTSDISLAGLTPSTTYQSSCHMSYPFQYASAKNNGIEIRGNGETSAYLHYVFKGANYAVQKGTILFCLTNQLWAGGEDLSILLALGGANKIEFTGGDLTETPNLLIMDINGLYLYSSNLSFDTNFKLNILHVVAVSWDAAYTKIWLDGIEVGSTTLAMPPDTPIDNPYVQVRLYDRTYPTNVLSDLMIWKQAIHDPVWHLNMANRFGAGR